MIDSSGSINGKDPSNWDTLLSFVQNVISRFTIGEMDVHVGAVVYSERVRVQLPIYIEVVIIVCETEQIGNSLKKLVAMWSKAFSDRKKILK